MPPRQAVPPAVKGLSLVSLFNDFASEMVYPLLPAFLTGVLGAGPVALGALDGAADFASAGVKYGTGRLADRPARRGPLVVVGYAVAVLVRPLIALTGAAWHVIALRVGDRVGKGMRSPARDAIIADATPAELRGRAFGLQRGLDHAGAVLGPIAAWALIAVAGADVRTVIGASVVPGIAVLGLAMVAVGDGRGRGAWGVGRGESAHSPRPTPHAPRPLPLSVFAISAFYLLRMPETLIILRSQDLGVPVAAVPLLWAGVHVAKAGASFAGGALSDRIGPGRTMWLGWVSYAAIAGGFAMAGGPIAAWVLFLAFGVVAGLTESPERALVAGLAGARQGTGFGNYHAATGLAALLGGLALGAVYQRWTAALAFGLSAAAGVALAVLWPFLASTRAALPAR
jgi:MFS family permease